MTVTPADAVADLEPEETVTLRVTVNNRAITHRTSPRRLLSDVLRHELGLTGTHVGCEHGVCGACTVLVDGHTARSCLLLAGQCEGLSITTIEGLSAPDGALSDLQQAFHDAHALQCGFCTPGFIVAVTEFLAEWAAPEPPTDDTLRTALAGNLCRCTGYDNIVRAVRLALERRAAITEPAPVLRDGPRNDEAER